MLTLGDATPPPDPGAQPAPEPVPPLVQTFETKALSTWNAILLGAVSGFALSLGAFLFSKLSKTPPAKL